MNQTKLKAGDNHYTAYVGPPEQYDFKGASQFRLLCTLGMRSHHTLLDFGCGSLRAGRLFIPYLDAGCYFGIEPNQWLIEEGIKNQIGEDQIRIKQPQFNHNSGFKTDVFNCQFDFIVAQSIFSHTGRELVRPALANFKTSLKPEGLAAVTFVVEYEDFTGEGWIYPQCVGYRHETVEQLAREAGFCVVRIPWYHQKQTWYLLAHQPSRLPTPEMMRHLRGVVLFDRALTKSWKHPNLIAQTFKPFVPQSLWTSIRGLLKGKKHR